jgi:hypothetical protein
MIRPRVWSPMESHSRLVAVDSGITEPRLLVWDEEEVVGEYNGTHEGALSRQDDNATRLLLEDQGWWLSETYERDIFTDSGRHRLAHRLRNGLSRLRNPTRDGS